METIAQPLARNTTTAGWNSKSPAPTVPKGSCSRIHPLFVQYAISNTIDSVVGIGVPSKYLLLPLVSLGSDCTVTLKRARRESPQSTKKVSRMVSRNVRNPSAKAQAAGAIPNEIYMVPCQHARSRWVVEEGGNKTDQIGQRIEFLAHQGTLLSPTRYLAVHKVEEQPKWHEDHREVQLVEITRTAEAIAKRREDAHCPTET